MEPQIFESFPVLSEEDLTGFGNSHLIRLPSEYRDFLLKHNGARPEPFIFNIPRPDLYDQDFSFVSSQRVRKAQENAY